MLLLVTYDLRRPGQNYDALYNELKSVPTLAWWHYLTSSWIIQTSENQVQLFDRLKRHLDANDYIMVLDITTVKDRKWGALPAAAWEWIDAQ